MSVMGRSFVGRMLGLPTQPLAELVALNLENVLNTRKGVGSVVREFGLGDYEDAPHTNAAVLVLVDELRDQCLRYEPRLREPQVEFLGRKAVDELRFELRAQLAGSAQAYWLDINTFSRHVLVTILRSPGE